jgi:hypothetical protein
MATAQRSRTGSREARGRPGAPAPPAAPASVVDGKLRVGDYELSGEDIASLMQTKAADDLRKTQIPASPEGYELKLPEAFKVPEGIEFKFNEADPLFADARRWAHGKGLDGQTWSEMLSFYAQTQIREAQAFKAAQAAELGKLGNFGTNRITSLQTWIRSQVGDELAGPMMSMIVSEKIVRAFEKLAGQHVTQGAASFSQAHRTPEPAPGGGRVSDEVYNAMSAAERWEYARSFSQSQFYPDRKNGGSDR